ncbi:hypothetical protein PG987_012359 [Apiospora arundinis]
MSSSTAHLIYSKIAVAVLYIFTMCSLSVPLVTMKDRCTIIYPVKEPTGPVLVTLRGLASRLRVLLLTVTPVLILQLLLGPPAMQGQDMMAIHVARDRATALLTATMTVPRSIATEGRAGLRQKPV